MFDGNKQHGIVHPQIWEENAQLNGMVTVMRQKDLEYAAKIHRWEHTAEEILSRF
jgi:hypothetical protein